MVSSFTSYVHDFRLGMNNFSACSERVLDLPGYVPFLGTQSSVWRFKLALIQVVVAGVLSVLGLILSLSTTLQPSAREDLSASAHENLHNGLGNLVRACFEGIPFVNCLLLIYDEQKDSSFDQLEKKLSLVSDKRFHTPILFLNLNAPIEAKLA